MLTVGGLFSGIGGWELGLERAGMRVLWHCEADPYARAVLERHWPGVPCYPDVRQVVSASVGLLPGDCVCEGLDYAQPVDVLCGGFPCQDLSRAGTRTGLDGARSGLWSEYARLVGELRPRYVLVENVPGLLVRGLERVLGDLAALGYDAEWDCIPAAAVGAPHLRDRVWIVAYPQSDGRGSRRPRRPAGRREGAPEQAHGRGVADAGRGRHGAPEVALCPRGNCPEHAGRWPTEPDVDRVAHGLPDQVDRLRAVGNALVPQIAEWIGRRITAFEEGRAAA